MQLFFPIPDYADRLHLLSPCTVEQLCERAGVRCKASGAWTGRLVDVVQGPKMRILAEPGSWGNVRIEIPEESFHERFQIALSAMAYSLNDLVARESVRGAAWNKLSVPRGRPRLGAPKSNRQRQRDFRRRANG